MNVLAWMGLLRNMPDRPMPGRDMQLTLSERLTALEVKFDNFSEESRGDRQGLRIDIKEARNNLNNRLDKMAEELAEQVKEQASRIAFVDALKWGVGMMLAALLSFFVTVSAYKPR